MQGKISRVTEKLRAQMPTWSAVRYDKDTVGAKFLNVFGLQFEDIEEYLQYYLDNLHIGTADIQMIDVIYKARMPKSIRDNMNITVIGKNRRLTEMQTVRMFYEGIDAKMLERREVYYPNPYFIDWEKKVIYTRYSYAPDEDFPEGKVTLRITDDEGEILFEHELRQTVHHIWNVFDEFGLLLDLSRLYGEKNKDYKERLLDVFLHKPNSSYIGMVNSIANELGLRKSLKRIVPETLEYTLEYTHVIPETIRLKRTIVHDMLISRIVDDEVTVNLMDLYQEGDIAEINFVSGISLHEFHNVNDTTFQDRLYTAEGAATSILKYYIDIIRQRVPTMWNQFIWNESFWNVADAEMSGYGVVPTFKDARFLAWQNFKK